MTTLRVLFSLLFLALSWTAAAAQTASPAPRAERPRASAEDRAAFTEARIAALKAGLQLTPAQEKNWPAVEAALRGNAQTRTQRIERWRRDRDAAAQDRAGDPAARLRRYAEMMTARAAEMTKLADAVDPLAKTLDDSQKRRLAVLMRGEDDTGWSQRRR
jgi:hypothetical protein